MMKMDQPVSLDHNKAAAFLHKNTFTSFILKYYFKNIDFHIKKARHAYIYICYMHIYIYIRVACLSVCLSVCIQ